MLRRTLALSLYFGFASVAQQRPNQPEPDKEPDLRLPNGKLQRDEILKAEHDKSLQDAAELVRLSKEVKQDLEKAGSFVVSLQTIKKTEEIEKLSKRIRNRLKRN